jgi:hypothetical protein
MNNRSDEIHELLHALSKFHQNLPVLLKDTSGHMGKHATLPKIFKEARPLLMQYDIDVKGGWEYSDGARILTFTLSHYPSKQWITDRFLMPQPENPKMTTLGGNITYFVRYAYNTILGISTDEDRDGDIGLVSESQYNIILSLLSKHPDKDSIKAKKISACNIQSLDCMTTAEANKLQCYLEEELNKL